MADSSSTGLEGRSQQLAWEEQQAAQRSGDAGERQQKTDPHPTNGHWRNPDWILCRDQKLRPIEPGTFPLAHGAPARVGRLRGYGNAIVATQAKAFIEAVMQSGGG